MKSAKKKQKLFSPSNIILALSVCFVLMVVFIPGFKSSIINGLMKIGLFQPDIERKHLATSLSNNQTVKIKLRNASNHTITLNNLKGKVIFINIWAIWCPPCKAELPTINELKKAVKDNTNIIILTLDADGNPGKAARYLEQHGFDLPVLSVMAPIPSFLESDAIPHTIVLDKKGFIAYQHTGAANYSSSKFIHFLEELAKE